MTTAATPEPRAPPGPARPSRRAVGRAVVWSAPVIAGVVLAPNAHAQATSTTLDVAVASRCVLLDLSSQGRGFVITVTGGPLPALSTFTLTSSGLLDLAALTLPGGTVLSTSLSPDQRTATITTQAPLTNGSYFLGLGVGLVNAAAATRFTLISDRPDRAPANSTATFTSLLGVGALGIDLNVCGA